MGQDINCGQAWYDRENRCAVIKCENEQSVIWFKKSILIIRVGKQCFRAWSFGERPKLFRLRAFLPDTYEHLDRNQIRAMIIHFNPEARDTLNLIGCVAVKKGRVVKLEVGPNFFEYCRVRDGKLNFLLGKINCSVSNVFIPDTENLTSEMEVEPTKEIGCESNVDQRENLRNEFSIEKLPEPNSEPMGGPLSPASAAAVEELMSEAEERAKKDSEGWINGSREDRRRRSDSSKRRDDFGVQIHQDRKSDLNQSSSQSSCSIPIRVSRGAERIQNQHEESNDHHDRHRRSKKESTSSSVRSDREFSHVRDRSHKRDKIKMSREDKDSRPSKNC